MKYRIDYQGTHDIDWFFQLDGKVYHAASNGGKLPDKIDSTTNRKLQLATESLKEIYEVKVADDVQADLESYGEIGSFKSYAAKGFISLDCRIDYPEDPHYHTIAFPKNGETIKDKYILGLLPELSETDITID